MGKRIYTEEHIEFLRENVVGNSVHKLTEMFNARFGLQKSYNAIKRACFSHGLHNGIDQRFKPGRPNKENTRYRPVGSELVNVRGCAYVKVSDSGERKDRYRRKHVAIWEEAHGPAPESHAVIFGDGDNKNFDIDNLVLVPRRIVGVLSLQGLRGASAELTKAGIALANLKMKIAAL